MPPPLTVSALVRRSLGGGGAKGNVDVDEDAAAGIVAHGQRRLLAIEAIDPRSRIRQADAFTPLPVLRQPRPIVPDAQPERVAVGLRLDRQCARTHQRLEAVANRVLDERLQDQRRHHHVQGGRVDPILDAQPIAEVHLLDVEIRAQILELLGQLDFLHADLAQRDAEQIAEPLDHRVRLLRIAMDERRDRVQRVEQEMRMQLLLQRLQLRFHQPRLEPRRPHLARAGLSVVIDGMLEPDQRPIHRQHLIDRAEERVGDRHPQIRRAASQSLQVITQQRDEHEMRAGDEQRCRNMDRDRGLPAAAIEAEVATEPEDHRRPQRVARPHRQVHQDEVRKDRGRVRPQRPARETVDRGVADRHHRREQRVDRADCDQQEPEGAWLAHMHSHYP